MSDKLDSYLAQLNPPANIEELFRRYGLAYGWLALTTVMFAMMASSLSSTVINVAIPDIMGAFGVGQDKAQWLATVNLAAGTVGMVISAWVVAEWGLRSAMFGMLCLFLFASVLGGVSPNLETMIIARALQGIAYGLIMPLTVIVVFMFFPSSHQATAMGLSSLVLILSPILGPAVGGFLIDAFHWRYVFYLAVPVTLVCLPLALIFLPARSGAKPNNPFDWSGVLLLSIAIGCLLVAISNGEREGWSSNFVLGLLAVAIVSGAAFVYTQLQSETPLFDLGVFAYREFNVYAIVAFTFGAGLFGTMYLIPLFLQLVQGMTPTSSGLALMPAGIAMALVMLFSGRLVDKYNASLLLAAGVLLFAVSSYLMNMADPNTAFWTFAWWTVIGRIGISVAVPTINLRSVQAVPEKYVAQAAGAINFIRQIGGAFGVMLIAVALERRKQFHLDSMVATQTPENIVSGELIDTVGLYLEAAGYSVVEQYVGGITVLGQMVHGQANMLSFRDVFLISAIAFLLMLVPILFLRDKKAGEQSEPERESTIVGSPGGRS